MGIDPARQHPGAGRIESFGARKPAPESRDAAALDADVALGPAFVQPDATTPDHDVMHRAKRPQPPSP